MFYHRTGLDSPAFPCCFALLRECERSATIPESDHTRIGQIG